MKENAKQDFGIIYKAENTLNGEIYIGATTYDLDKRKADHIQRASRGDTNTFQEAISTYGAEAFNWEQIDTATNSNELAEKEKSSILLYKSKEEGYNQDSGGGFQKKVYQYSLDGSLIKTYTNLQDAANAVGANKRSISSVCLNINRTCKGYYWSYNYSEPFLPETDRRKKDVIQYSIEGKLIAKYKSVAEASGQTGISKTCISRVCRGEREQTGGYVWKYIQQSNHQS